MRAIASKPPFPGTVRTGDPRTGRLGRMTSARTAQLQRSLIGSAPPLTVAGLPGLALTATAAATSPLAVWRAGLSECRPSAFTAGGEAMVITGQAPPVRVGRTRRRPGGRGPRWPGSRLAPPGARSASIAERTACSEASVSAILGAVGGSAAGPPRAGRTASAPDHRARRWISDHRTAASAAASPPGASVMLIASCRAEAFRVRIDEAGPPASPRLPSGGERARDQRDQAGQDKDAQQDPEPDQAGAGGGDGRRGTGGPRLGGGGRRDAGPGRGGRGPARQGADRACRRCPRIRPRAIRRQAGPRGGESLFAERRDADPSASCMADRRSLRSPAQDRCPRVHALVARPCDPQAAWLGGLCLRHHRDCTAPRSGQIGDFGATFRCDRNLSASITTSSIPSTVDRTASHQNANRASERHVPPDR